MVTVMASALNYRNSPHIRCKNQAMPLINANTCISGHISFQQLHLSIASLIPIPQNIFDWVINLFAKNLVFL